MSCSSGEAGHRLRIPMSLEDRSIWEGCLGRMAIIHSLGVELDLQDAYSVRLHLKRTTAAHHGGLGTFALNGAMIAGMMDCAMSVAGILHFRGQTCGTLHLSVNFMKPVRFANPTIECYAVRKAPNMIFLEACLVGRDCRSSVSATGIVGLATLKQAEGAAAKSSNWLMPAECAIEQSGDSCFESRETDDA